MKAKTLDLCKPCAEELMAGGWKVTPVQLGVDRKITCAQCRRRRFGAAYEIRKNAANKSVD